MKYLIVNSNKKVLIFSLILALYFLIVMLPFGEKCGIFSENNLTQSYLLLAYFILTTPIFLIYLAFLFYNFNTITFLKSINYSIITFNIFFGSFVCLSVLGGAILWFALFAFPAFFIVLILSFIIGIIKDIKYFKTDQR